MKILFDKEKKEVTYTMSIDEACEVGSAIGTQARLLPPLSTSKPFLTEVFRQVKISAMNPGKQVEFYVEY